MKRINFINYSKRPAHKKHIDAYIRFLDYNKYKLSGFLASHFVFVQTTHPFNVFWMFIARLLGKKVIFYYHEPCFYLEKIKKKNTHTYSALVKFVQTFEVFLSDRVLVSSEFLIRKVSRLHGRRVASKCVSLPLLIDAKKELYLEKEFLFDVLFIGRAIPDQRSLLQFFECASKFSDLKFAILTADRIKIPDNIFAISLGTRFSEDLRLSALSSSKCVWNVYNSNYNQSGVVPDALASGCSLIVSRYEKNRLLRMQEYVLTYGVDLPDDVFLEFVSSAPRRVADCRSHFVKYHDARLINDVFIF